MKVYIVVRQACKELPVTNTRYAIYGVYSTQRRAERMRHHMIDMPGRLESEEFMIIEEEVLT